jgi:hypothetical protein
MPMRVRPANRSTRAWASAATRVQIAPTVRHAIRINSATAVLDVCTANHATWSSKAWVCPAPCRAHATATTVGPCSGQSTRGASASTNIRAGPTSRARQRRRPSPRS